jgi:hypothetical protein
MVRFRSGVPRARLRGQLVWFVAWLAVTLFAAILRPSADLHGTHQQLGLPACPSVALFDRPCFGCGMTTSFTSVVHGDFATAWKAHPFGPFFYLLFTASAFLCLWGWRKGLYLDTDGKAFYRATIALTVAFVAFGVFRFSTSTYDSDEYRITQQVRGLPRGEQRR